MQIRVLAVPNAKASEVVGWEEDPRAGRVLRVKIAAAPVDGKANAALRDFLAGHFGFSAVGPDLTPDDWAGLAAAVPEPALWSGAMLLTAASLLKRNRRARLNCSH